MLYNLIERFFVIMPLANIINEPFVLEAIHAYLVNLINIFLNSVTLM